MSRPQVTITLGRSGQVVKRQESSSSDYVPSSGTGSNKRSIKDRLGSNVDANDLHNSKRQRRDGDNRNFDDIDGVRIDQNDLRYKLLRKKQSNVDLREKLSRAKQPPARTETRQRVTDPRSPDTRHRMPEPRSPDTRQRMPEQRATDTRHRMPEIRATDTRQRMPDPRSADTRHRVPEANGIMRRVPPTRSPDDMEYMRTSYSGWSLDELRRRSPDRLLGSARGLSPPRSSMEVRRAVRHISSGTHIDGSRCSPYIAKDVFDPSGPTTFLSKASVPLESSVGRLPPPSAPGATQKVSYTGEEVTVSSLMHSLGLGKYAILFQAEEVDLAALKQMSDSDLKELGIPMGPRKKILLTLAERSKRHP